MSIVTILILILFFGVSFTSKAKKAMEEQSVPVGGSAVPAEDEGDMSMREEKAASEMESPYFTYETVDDIYRPSAAPKAAPAPVMNMVAEETVRPQFDLKQAVVSQVILNNKYIDEINQ